MEKTIDWKNGDGFITITYNGSGTEVISITSTVNNTGGGRSQEIDINTTYPYDVNKRILIYQEGYGSIDGGIASTNVFNNTIDCSTADSEFGEGDVLYDCGGANL